MIFVVSYAANKGDVPQLDINSRPLLRWLQQVGVTIFFIALSNLVFCEYGEAKYLRPILWMENHRIALDAHFNANLFNVLTICVEHIGISRSEEEKESFLALPNTDYLINIATDWRAKCIYPWANRNRDFVRRISLFENDKIAFVVVQESLNYCRFHIDGWSLASVFPLTRERISDDCWIDGIGYGCCRVNLFQRHISAQLPTRGVFGTCYQIACSDPQKYSGQSQNNSECGNNCFRIVMRESPKAITDAERNRERGNTFLKILCGWIIICLVNALFKWCGRINNNQDDS
jgi:hypothetical protein